MTPVRIRQFRSKIFHWWASHRRDLLWRETRDPYKILVSEVMLQQTQVSRVLGKYEEFLFAFPDVYSLSAAPPSKVLRVWKGMGYNRRALYLQRAAKEIANHHFGEFPEDEVQLAKLPGVGKYTARAILVFAYGVDIALVDTNIRKIITHFFFHGRKQPEKTIWEAAERLRPVGRSWEWHQALMDYGALGFKLAHQDRGRGTASKREPFIGSARFYRGRIVDLLRDGERAESEVVATVSSQATKTKVELRTIIAGLVADGLVVRTNGTLHLPEILT